MGYIAKIEQGAWLNGDGSSGYTIVQNYAKVFMSIKGAKSALTKLRNSSGKECVNAEVLKVEVRIDVVNSPGPITKDQAKVLGLIRDTWARFPDLRLCQMLSNAAKSIRYDNNDLFYISDDTIHKGLSLMGMNIELGGTQSSRGSSLDTPADLTKLQVTKYEILKDRGAWNVFLSTLYDSERFEEARLWAISSGAGSSLCKIKVKGKYIFQYQYPDNYADFCFATAQEGFDFWVKNREDIVATNAELVEFERLNPDLYEVE